MVTEPAPGQGQWREEGGGLDADAVGPEPGELQKLAAIIFSMNQNSTEKRTP